MFNEKVENLAESIRLKQQISQNTQVLKGFRTRKQQIVEYQSSLQERQVVVDEFIQHNFEPPTVNSAADDFIEEVEYILEKFSGDPFWIIQGLKNTDIGNTCRTLVKALDSYIQSNWQVLTSEFPVKSFETLDVLGNIPSFKERVEQIKITCIKIDNLRKQKMPQTGDISRYKSLVDKFDSLWLEFESDDIPDEVEVFLRSAGTVGGADLELLTDEVFEWINNHHIEDSLGIKFR